MITLPSLPTDNLYKFMAISGLVLVVTSTIIIWSNDKKLTSIMEEQTRRDGIFQATVQRVIDARALPAQQEKEIMQMKAELDSGYKVFDLAFNAANFYANLALGLEGFGLVVAAMGFWLWYTRIQVHQDRVLAAQAKQIKEAESQDGKEA